MTTPAPERRVYLDHAAATPLAAAVAEAMREAEAEAFANPSSPHAAGRAAKRILEDARERILALVGGRTSGSVRDRLVFTSGATEANRLAILGLAAGWGGGGVPAPGWIAFSARDHSSIRHPARELGQRGWRLCEAPLGPRGALAAEAVVASAHESPADHAGRILAVTTVCGHSGIREDTSAVEWIAAGVPGLCVHADATQAAGWDEIAFATSPWATLALAPHKFGGPRGIGGVVVRGGVPLAATVPGSQELGLRGGTEAVYLASGFARALELSAADRTLAAARVTALRERLEAGLVAAARRAGYEALVVGAEAPRAPHVALVALAGVDRQVAALAADMAGVCLATGTACASGSTEPPAILAALGVPDRFRDGGLRLSLGRTTTPADVEAAIVRLSDVFVRLAGAGPAPGASKGEPP
ncbi:MAG: cysteine desulfurase family protein [Planctomycetota bacterium]